MFWMKGKLHVVCVGVESARQRTSPKKFRIFNTKKVVQKILKISQTCAHAEKKFENLWADSLMVYRKINLKETANRISCRLEHQLDAVHTCIYSSLPPVSFNEKKWTVKAFRCFFSALSRRRRSCDWFDPRTVVLLPPSSLLPPRPSLDLRLTTTEWERESARANASHPWNFHHKIYI